MSDGRVFMRDLERFGVGERNSMRYWYKIRSPIRVALNFLVFYACRFLPSLGIKNLLYRILGMKVGRDVSIGLGAMFDIFFPELIEIGENSIIGYNVVILAHEYLTREWRRGKVSIGRNVMVGANATILPGVTIGDGATVYANSLVNRDVEPNSRVAGVPIEEVTCVEQD